MAVEAKKLAQFAKNESKGKPKPKFGAKANKKDEEDLPEDEEMEAAEDEEKEDEESDNPGNPGDDEEDEDESDHPHDEEGEDTDEEEGGNPNGDKSDEDIADEVGDEVEAGETDQKLMDLMEGYNPEEDGNPPEWVASESTWERAKKSVEKNWEGYDEPWAVVAHVYKQMGGGMK